MSSCIHYKMLTLVNVSPPAVEFYRMVVLVDLHVSSGEGDTHLKHFRAWWINCLFFSMTSWLRLRTQHTAHSMVFTEALHVSENNFTFRYFSLVHNCQIRQYKTGADERIFWVSYGASHSFTMNNQRRMPAIGTKYCHTQITRLFGGWNTTQMNYYKLLLYPMPALPRLKELRAEVNTKRKHRLLGKLLRFHCFRQFSVLLQYSK